MIDDLTESGGWQRAIDRGCLPNTSDYAPRNIAKRDSLGSIFIAGAAAALSRIDSTTDEHCIGGIGGGEILQHGSVTR